MHNITPEAFINAIFPADVLDDDECVVIAHPAEYNGKPYFKQFQASPRLFKKMARQEDGWLYCVSSAYKPPNFGRVSRKKENLHSAFALVLDDIGTKAQAPPLAPNYILETSPRNFQFGYFLQPFPVNNPINSYYYNACLRALADAGFNDPGATGSSRCVKIPGARHATKNFTAVLHRWQPDQGHYDLPDLMDAFGVPMPPPDAEGLLSWHDIHLTDEKWSPLSWGDVKDDPVVLWLDERKMFVGDRSAQWLHMRCPWESEHSKGELGETLVPGSSTSYSPEGYGFPGRQWDCRHGHCAHRNTKTFHDWVEAQGGPALGIERDHSQILKDYFGEK